MQDKQHLVGWRWRNPPSRRPQPDNYIKAFVGRVAREDQTQFTTDKTQAHKFTKEQAGQEAKKLAAAFSAIETFILSPSKINQNGTTNQ